MDDSLREQRHTFIRSMYTFIFRLNKLSMLAKKATVLPAGMNQMTIQAVCPVCLPETQYQNLLVQPGPDSFPPDLIFVDTPKERSTVAMTSLNIVRRALPRNRNKQIERRIGLCVHWIGAKRVNTWAYLTPTEFPISSMIATQAG